MFLNNLFSYKKTDRLINNIIIRNKPSIIIKKIFLSELNLLALLIIILCFDSCYGQEDSTYTLKGQILNEDSLPVENVYVINYRSLKFDLSNENGRFYIPVIKGDSLKTYHISYDPVIIKTTDSVPVYYLHIALYDLLTPSIVCKKTSVYDEILLKNFERNWNRMIVQIQKEVSYLPPKKKPNIPHNSSTNGFDPPVVNKLMMSNHGSVDAGLSIEAICDKVKEIQRKRRQNRHKKK